MDVICCHIRRPGFRDSQPPNPWRMYPDPPLYPQPARWPPRNRPTEIAITRYLSAERAGFEPIRLFALPSYKCPIALPIILCLIRWLLCLNPCLIIVLFGLIRRTDTFHNLLTPII